MNVLFLSVDDLKPDLGSYGSEVVKSPNMDRLASQGTIMTNNHCQQAVCAPSRMSMFSGRRPDTTKVWDLKTHIVKSDPDAVMMQEHFKNNGYETAGAGKIMHGSDPTHSNPQSWSIPYTFDASLPYAEGYPVPANDMYQGKKSHEAVAEMEKQGITHWKKQRDFLTEAGAMPATEMLDVPDDAYADGALAVWANKMLEQFAASGKPFFLTIGFKKPHLPFVAPKKYWDLYDREKLSLAPFRERAKDSFWHAYQSFGELKSYSDISREYDVDNQLPVDQQKELIHAYYACISYTDAQIGLVLDKLKALGLAENTIVVLWGDHGYHLGDHGMWNKHSNFEQATRSPLMIAAPGLPQGKKASGPTEFIDIYPTLLELTGMKAPYEMEGKSLVPMLKDSTARVKEFAISQYPRQGGKLMGYALRNDRYRFVLWMKAGWRSTDPFNESLVEATELYDYEKDPNETISFAADPAYAEVVQTLKAQMKEFFKTHEKEITMPTAPAGPVSEPQASGSMIDLAEVDIATLALRFSKVSRDANPQELVLDFENSPKWPSVDFFPPAGGVWNVSGAGGIEVELTNQSDQPVMICGFVTNSGDSNANKMRRGGRLTMAPGQKATLLLDFNEDLGPFDPSQIVTLKLFVNKVSAASRFILHSVKAAGNSTSAPAAATASQAAPAVGTSAVGAAKPGPGGELVDFGEFAQRVKETRFTTYDVAADAQSVQLNFELSPKWPSIDVMPKNAAAWDLSGYSSVEVTLTNKGDQQIKAFSYVANEGDAHQTQKRSQMKMDILPGETQVLTLALAANADFDPAAVAWLRIFTGMHKAPVTMQLESIRAVNASGK